MARMDTLHQLYKPAVLTEGLSVHASTEVVVENVLRKRQPRAWEAQWCVLWPESLAVGPRMLLGYNYLSSLPRICDDVSGDQWKTWRFLTSSQTISSHRQGLLWRTSPYLNHGFKVWSRLWVSLSSPGFCSTKSEKWSLGQGLDEMYLGEDSKMQRTQEGEQR